MITVVQGQLQFFCTSMSLILSIRSMYKIKETLLKIVEDMYDDKKIGLKSERNNRNKFAGRPTCSQDSDSKKKMHD